MPDNVGLDQHKPTSLRGIANKASVDKQHRFQNLYRMLDEALLRDSFRELNKQSAAGIDQVTAAQYAENLQANIQDLVIRLKSKRYRTKRLRRSFIPKENGEPRPLGIPALEDKLVQRACATLLTAIYEQEFLDCSYGYRQNRSAQEAVQDLTFELQYGRYGYVVEADIRGFFDNMDHDQLCQMLEQRIDDQAFLGLIRQWLKAGILETDGCIIHPQTGTPQGGIVSPILANVYLHHVLDRWFHEVVLSHCQGKAMMVRYADDWVCAFQFQNDAERFYRVLPKRLGKFHLEVAPNKTQILRFSRYHLSMTRRFVFLGFEFCWNKDRQGVPRVRRRTARKKLQGACRRIKQWIKANRHEDGATFFKGLNSRLRGHYQYYGLRGNYDSLRRFFWWATECTFKWLNRRGGKKRSFNWATFVLMLDRVKIAKPRITERRRPAVMA